ncbi:MAG: hypothetical protein UU42_C0006G0019 [Candidatus Woesebacteria bacterium GW2011_GWA1_41_13b]|uniref:Uncharacterized protein n=1 Tax=Candidatus Woesebacteria bacterium GW2011_GWA1_41_13b TaxID=1618555 RepID=A0A0G0X5P7_9BACT|nr:MAG: hypothetical protein UU42_C0006G0019 [Candidatus Woesebacteria bacterium GW2011_GWA1_41_13b]
MEKKGEKMRTRQEIEQRIQKWSEEYVMWINFAQLSPSRFQDAERARQVLEELRWVLGIESRRFWEKD